MPNTPAAHDQQLLLPNTTLPLRSALIAPSAIELPMFTDGACKGNPGPGGWGVWWRIDEQDYELCGGEPLTTNNRMELVAVIQGLNAVPVNSAVALTLDSTYVRTGVLEWLARWKQNGWQTTAKQAVKNQDLWQQLDALLTTRQVRWLWVRGHSGHDGNERADRLAQRGLVLCQSTGGVTP